MSDLLRAFFEDLARAEDDVGDSARALLTEDEVPVWVTDVAAAGLLREALSSPEQVEAFSRTVEDLAHIALHSALVAIDGGSPSAEVGRVQLVAEQGGPLATSLHEEFVDHLFATGRLV
jgi:hypothetical protein